MKQGGGGAPSGPLAEAITKDFGSFDEFKKQFTVAGNTAFGSGWAWLCVDPKTKKLSVTKSIGAGNPITDGATPILTMDVWEHAYYLDYQNLRAKYADTFLDKLVNWDFVSSNFAKA
jgi:Fe-Mn family superoxide dismutase